MFTCFPIAAQLGKEAKDTATYKDSYGLRVGIDVVRPVYSAFSDDTKGFEIVGDYRVTNRFYIATELGYRDQTTYEDFFDFSLLKESTLNWGSIIMPIKTGWVWKI